jgi:hypothetical protein
MMYKSIDVWKRLGESRVVRYRCFEVLPNCGYCVQSADFYEIPIDTKQCSDHDKQFLELLTEEAPEVRSGLFASLEEAIRHHDSLFP